MPRLMTGIGQQKEAGFDGIPLNSGEACRYLTAFGISAEPAGQ